MKVYKFKIFIGIRFSENFTDRERKNVYDEIEDLSSYYQLTFNECILVEKVKFSFAKSEKETKKVDGYFDWVNSDEILIVEFESDGKTFNDNNLYYESFIEKRIRDLILGISIAKKGGVDYGQNPILFIDNKLISTLGSSIHSIGLCAEKANKIKWPKLKMLDLKTTLTWLNKYQSQMDSLSNNKVGRALNAYSHLFSDNGEINEGSSLFWAMLGIEALYTSETENVMSQVNLKTQVLLGYRKEFKKSVKEMYAYRSSFVHGSLDITNKFILHDHSERDYTHWENYYENEHLAIAVLIATFQKMILKNLIELDFDFEYKLRTDRITNKKLAGS